VCGVVFIRFFLVGTVFSFSTLGISFFQSGVRAEYLRYFSIIPVLILATLGLFRAGLVLAMYYLRSPRD
jgi:hypothetical protein